MKKYLLAFGVAFAILILLMLLTPVLFKGKIRELAVSQANKNLDAHVSLGDINISLFRNFPQVYIGLQNLTIINREPFQGDTLAHIPTLAVTVNLPDMLDGSPYTVNKILLREPDLRLRVMHDGTPNWDIIPAGDTTNTVDPPEETPPFSLKLHSVEVDEGRLIYDDIFNKVYVVLAGLDHHLSGDLSADRTQLDTRTHIEKAYVEYGMIPYLNQAGVSIVASLDADLENSIYRLEDNSLKINDLLLNFEGSFGYLGDDLNLLLTLQAPENSFKNILSLLPAVYAKEFASVKTEGIFTLKGFVKGVYNKNSLPAFRAELDVKDAWFKYPDLPGRVENISLAAYVENPGGDADNTVLDIQSVGFSIAQNTLKGALKVVHPITDPELSLMAVGKIDLEDVSSIYPFEEGEGLQGTVKADLHLEGKLSDVESGNSRDFQALGYFHVNDVIYHSRDFNVPVSVSTAQVNVSPAYLDLVALDVQMGNSDFRAEGKIEDYLAYFLDDGILKGNLLVDAGRIDLNELMASGPQEEEVIPSVETEEDSPDTLALSPLLLPDDIDMELNASIEAVDYESIRAENLKGRVKMSGSKLILKGLTMDVFGGNVLLNGSYETTDPSSPLVDLALGLKVVDIGEVVQHIPLIEKYVPLAFKVSGDASGNINLAAVLDNTMMPLYETVTGLGNLKTGTLEITGVNTLDTLATTLKMSSLKSLHLDPVRLSFQFMEGTLNVKPFDFQVGDIAMNLGGWTSLNQEIGYELNMKIPRSAFGSEANDVLDGLLSRANQLGTEIALGEKVQLKALIDGTLADPMLKIDFIGTGKGALEGIKEEVVEEVSVKVSEQAGEILREARTRADAIMAQAQKEVDRLMENANKLARETRKQADVNAGKIENEAKDKGALAMLAARKTAEELRKEGDKQAQNVVDEARKQSENILQQARQEVDEIMQDARNRADAL